MQVPTVGMNNQCCFCWDWVPLHSKVLNNFTLFTMCHKWDSENLDYKNVNFVCGEDKICSKSKEVFPRVIQHYLYCIFIIYNIPIRKL